MKETLDFGKYKGKHNAEVPDTYLDWLLGENWFWAKHPGAAAEVVKELETRKRSHYHIEDEFGKTLEEL